MPGKIKFALFTLIASLTVIFSYIFSDDLYTRYLTFWHVTVKKTSPADVIDHAEKIRHTYEKKIKTTAPADKTNQNKEYTSEMISYLAKMNRVFGKSTQSKVPDNIKDLVFYTGNFFLDNGEPIRGAELILSVSGESLAPNELVPFKKAIDTLYQKQMYSDICVILSTTAYPPDHDFLIIHATSLYCMKHYNQAHLLFKKVESTEAVSSYVYGMHARTLLALGQKEEALTLAQKALSMSPRDATARELVVSVFKSLGKYKEASKFSR